jgi:DNA-directed RNA polymerase subunit RPC12/RpoP
MDEVDDLETYFPVEFNCAACGQSLEAPSDLAGQMIQCPSCEKTIRIPYSSAIKPSSLPPPTLPLASIPEEPDPDLRSDIATEKQIAYICALGGSVRPGMTKEQASGLIDKLRTSAPPTQKQLDLLNKLGARIPDGITSAQASELISEIDGNQSPTKQQIKYIKMLGGNVPRTKREASALCDTLSTTALATAQQKKQAPELGVTLPEEATFTQANQLLGEAEMDADEEDGKPPSKAEISKILKLGGDPAKATNAWRTEQYVEELEEAHENFRDRVDQALESLFSDADDRSLMSVKKPSKSILAKALEYGDDQGWGAAWEDDFAPSSPSPYERMSVAIFAVAPDLLKKGESPPRLLSRAEADEQFQQALAWASQQRNTSNSPAGKRQSRQKGCIVPLAFVLFSGALVVMWCMHLLN